ncbi:hypothetical protein AB0B45_02665 [Nonomuraea sp. NPDC049152]|uniref:hypothetical protein n=1 Tax=Nonomuraea sp. NPDC049152 TaxID=3154350 RepID=UPI0033E9F39E
MDDVSSFLGSFKTVAAVLAAAVLALSVGASAAYADDAAAPVCSIVDEAGLQTPAVTTPPVESEPDVGRQEMTVQSLSAHMGGM